MIITGLARLGRDAELRHVGSGDVVASLSLAVNYGKKAPEQQVQWIDGSMWGKRAEALAPYLTKGTLIYFVAEDPHIEEFERRNNAGRGSKLVARVTQVEFAGGKKEGASPAPAPAPQPVATSPVDGLEDDIPF